MMIGCWNKGNPLNFQTEAINNNRGWAGLGGGRGGLQDDKEHGDVRQRHEIVQARVVAEHWCLSSQHKHPADLKAERW